jgi:uncharacterized protein (AIM24 family)
MFCTNCGNPVPDSANFCTACGSIVRETPAPASSEPTPPAAPVQYSQPVQPPPRPSQIAAEPPSSAAGLPTTCPWCRAEISATQLSCPRCGATVNAPAIRSESGWGELPGRKDMAKLQFGDSFCQIEGLYVPVADVNLSASDSIYFTHHVLLWKDPQVNMTTMSLASGWKRMFAGLPLIMMQAQGPGHIAFSRDAPGEMIALPLQQDEEVDVREHLFMLATSNVTYDWFSSNIWYTTQSGDEKETHYPVGMFMDRFCAPQTPGLLLLHASGNVFVRDLAPGQTILVKPTALIFKDPSVQMQLHFEHPRAGFGLGSLNLGGLNLGDLNLGNINLGGFNLGSSNWGNRYYWLRLFGPGRIAVQSVFDRMEGESRYLSNCSSATEQRW